MNVPGQSRRRSRFGVRLKFVCSSSTLVICLCSMAGIFFSLRSQAFLRTSQQQDLSTAMQLLAQTLAEVLPDPEGETSLQQLCQQAAKWPGVEAIACFDGRGRMCASAETQNSRVDEEALALYGRSSDIEVLAALGVSRDAVFELPILRSIDSGSLLPRGTVVATLDSAALEERASSVQQQIWSVVLLAGTIAAILVYVLTRSIIRPVSQLIEGTARLGHGDAHAQLPVERPDEVGWLANAIDKMSTEVLETNQRLGEEAEDLQAIVDERTRDLKGTHERLQWMDRQKDAFLSNISHEFRTPITCVRSAAEILMSVPAGDQDEREFLDMLGVEATTLEDLIGKLITFVDLDRGRRKIAPVDLDVVALLKDCVQRAQPAACEKNIKLHTTMEAQHLASQWDQSLMTGLFAELLSNAIQFSPDESEVVILLEAGADACCITVSDHGPGIPEEMRSAVFGRFDQIGNILTEKPSGTGMGLPLARSIARLHGGTIHLEDREGFATSVVVVLPLQAPRSTAPSRPSRETSAITVGNDLATAPG